MFTGCTTKSTAMGTRVLPTERMYSATAKVSSVGNSHITRMCR